MSKFATLLLTFALIVLLVPEVSATNPQQIVVIEKDHTAATTYSSEYKVMMGSQVIGNVNSVELVNGDPTFYIAIHPAYSIPVNSSVSIEFYGFFERKLNFVSSGRKAVREIDTLYVDPNKEKSRERHITNRLDEFFYKISHENDSISFLKIDTLNEDYSIGCTEYSEEFKLYKSPYLITKTDTTFILNYDGYVTDGFELSPNNKYVYAAGLDIGWVETGDSTFLHDRWSCMLINLKTARIEEYMFDDCTGGWNQNDQWVVDGLVLFPRKEENDN